MSFKYKPLQMALYIPMKDKVKKKIKKIVGENNFLKFKHHEDDGYNFVQYEVETSMLSESKRKKLRDFLYNKNNVDISLKDFDKYSFFIFY